MNTNKIHPLKLPWHSIYASVFKVPPSFTKHNFEFMMKFKFNFLHLYASYQVPSKFLILFHPYNAKKCKLLAHCIHVFYCIYVFMYCVAQFANDGKLRGYNMLCFTTFQAQFVKRIVIKKKSFMIATPAKFKWKMENCIYFEQVAEALQDWKSLGNPKAGYKAARQKNNIY